MRAWSSARGKPPRLCTSSAPFRKTPTGGLLFPAGEEIFSVDLELKAIVEPDLTFRVTMTSQTTGRRDGLAAFLAWERCKQMAASGPLFFVVERRNK
jgi:hypothetical protein